MAEASWAAVDRYVEDMLLGADEVLAETLASAARAGLPEAAVTPSQGMLLTLLARIAGARRILEVGTLAGYSTIWLARGMAAGGRLVSLEAIAEHAAVARANLARAGLDAVAEVRVGPALTTLAALALEGAGPFDLVFLDADKERHADYLEWAVGLGRPGTVIVADNVVRGGALADEASQDPRVLGVRHFHERVAADPRLTATTIQTVGAKGHDGFTLALVGA